MDIPQRFLDRLSPSVLETSRVAQDERASVSPEILTLEGLFKRYYTARQAAGAAERTLEDYQNKIPHPHHMCAIEAGTIVHCLASFKKVVMSPAVSR
ncbi:hypothetical protein [Paenibacillus polymyxa]|uniref:hypothetical protein n=1 Tax=Paenibacillus polymyxa TaxID=1406 RepID=UPI001F2EE0D2|nr:hypothetical protein [Paenibacillus polymyxa]